MSYLSDHIIDFFLTFKQSIPELKTFLTSLRRTRKRSVDGNLVWYTFQKIQEAICGFKDLSPDNLEKLIDLLDNAKSLIESWIIPPGQKIYQKDVVEILRLRCIEINDYHFMIRYGIKKLDY